MSGFSANQEQSKIYWRPETESYFPRIDDEEITGLLIVELKRHASEVQSGSLVSVVKKYNQDSPWMFRRKPKTEERETDFDSLGVTNDFLQELLGTWIPDNFVWAQLWNFQTNKEVIISIPDDELGEAINILVASLNEIRDCHDDFFQQVAPVLNPPEGEPNPDLLPAFSQLLKTLVVQAAEATGCADHWYFDLCSELGLYAKTEGIPLTTNEIDSFASRYFSSWFPPDENSIERFANQFAVKFIESGRDH